MAALPHGGGARGTLHIRTRQLGRAARLSPALGWVPATDVVHAAQTLNFCKDLKLTDPGTTSAWPRQ